MAVLHTQAVILAAGKSTRFNTGTTKLIEKICGQEMILFPTKLFASLQVPTTVVVGHQKELIQEVIVHHHANNVNFAVQEQQQGTGHALLCSRAFWQAKNILVMNGDMPLVTNDIIEKLYQKHNETNAAISFVTAHNADPSIGAYGRVVANENIVEIIEARDFTLDPSEHCFINAGIYLIDTEFLTKHIESIKQQESNKEFYIVDLIKIASLAGLTVSTIVVPFDQVRGVNTFQELWSAEQIKKAQLIQYWMERGVRFYTTCNVHLDLDVTIGTGTFIGCGVHILRGSIIGKNCKINELVSIYNATIGDNSTIYTHSIIKDSMVGFNSLIGPFAHIRDNTIIGEHVSIGNFVEVKKSRVGDQTKARHLAYLGNAIIGNNVNIGAGTITCNFNGISKLTTTIQDNVFIGSNSTLVAPITLGKDSFVAAGSTITQSVPERALAIGRVLQHTKNEYAPILREKFAQKAQHDKDEEQEAPFVGARKANHTQMHEGS